MFAGPSEGPDRKQKTKCFLNPSRPPFSKGRRNFPLFKGGLRGICQTLGVPRQSRVFT
jgi:hypothetical protein